MFLRASKVEAEAAGESTEGMANSVSELRDKLLALTNDRVDILTDSGKYKSTYEILKDIAAVWDDIVSNQGTDSAALLELIGGKRNANVVAAILENFEIAEDALRVATESTGSAIAENEKHLNSIQGTIAKFTAQFESLSATFINSEFVKGIVNFGTFLLQTLEVVGNLVNMLGGLSNVLFTIAGIILTIKIDSIVGRLADIAGSIKNLTFLTGTFGTTFKQCFDMARLDGANRFRATLTGISGGMYEAAAGASALQIALGSLVAVISIISIARTVINKIKQEQAEARQEAIRSAEAASELSDGISDLAIQYAYLTEAVKSDASAKESLIATEDALIEKLGLEQYEVNKLKENYSSLSRAIQETSLAELERQGLDISAGKNARKDELLEAAKEYGLANKSMNNIIVNWTKESAEANHAALNALVEAGYITSSMYSSLGAGLSLPMDGFELDKVYGIIAAHERLGDMLRIVKDEAGDETDVYKALYTEYSRVSGALSNYQNIVGEYNNNLSRQHILQGLINNKMPTTEAEFEQYKDSVVAAVAASGDFVGSAEEIEGVIDGILKNDSSFAGFYAESIENATSGFKEEAVAVDNLKDKLLELTAAYSKWQAAQSGAESGDIYDDSKQALEQILAGLESGKVGTEKYKAAVEFLVPEANREDVSAYVESLKRYISEDAAGVSNFISDAITAGLMIDDGLGNINIVSDATVQDFCNKLKITPDMAQAIFGELREYDWDIKFAESDFTTPEIDTTPTEKNLQDVEEEANRASNAVDVLSAKTIGDLGATETIVHLQDVVAWMVQLDEYGFSPKHLKVYTHTIPVDGGQSSANGTSSADGGRTLVGELGAELVVSGDRYYLVGQNGAEFVNLKRGDMVFNHVDTQKILAGKSGVRGQALRNGTDPKMAYLGEAGQTILVEVNTDEVYVGGGGKDISGLAGQNGGSGGAGSGGSGSGGGSNSDEESWFERQLKDHKHLVEMDQESQSDYLDWLEDAYQKAYEEGIIDIDEFYKYEEEVYKGRRDLVEQAEKDAKSSIDNLVEYRIKMLKQEIEDEKDAVKKKLDALKEFYDKQREMLQDQYDEEKYLEEQAEKRKSVSDIRAELAMLERDDSAWAQRRRIELQEQLAEAEKDLNNFERDHALDKTLDMLDKQQAAQEALLQAEIDALDAKLNDPHALFNQALADIKANTEELYNAFIEYNRKHGTGNDEDIADMWEEAYIADQEYQETHNGEHLDGIEIGNYTGYVAPEPPATTQPESSQESAQTLPYGKASDVSGNIGVGSSGEQVRAIQYALNALGFGNSGTQSCDGQFGSGTQTAVRAFQSAMGITSDGIVGANTKAKFRSMGYSMGTRSASPGIHMVDELGPEFVFESADGNRYRVFRGGEKVLNANATNFLYEFANHGRDILSEIIRSLAGGSISGKINGVAQVFDIDMGDIIVQGNADSRTVSQIRREQRQSVDYMLKEIGRLKR